MENIFLSIHSVFQHKMRSILTMLGVIVGIAAIIAIFSIIEGNTANMKQQLIGGSNNTMNIEFAEKARFDPTLQTAKEAKKPLYIPILTEENLAEIQSVKGVLDASISYPSNQQLFIGKKGVMAQVSSIMSNYLELKNITLIKGKKLTEEDFFGNSPKIMLSEALYTELFGDAEDKIGRYIEINSYPFKVIGIFKENSGDTFLSNSKTAYVPYGQWHHLFEEINVVPNILIHSKDTDQLKKSAQLVAEKLNKQFPKSDYLFGVYNSEVFEKQTEEFNRSNFFLLAGIASISLIVGGIGVMNIMLVSVTERTKEIGLKKALGARRKVILNQFLMEAIILTLMGGLLGILFGIVVGRIITHMLNYPYILSLLSVCGSLLFCCVVGIIFGLLPAVKASRLDPIEALRFE